MTTTALEACIRAVSQQIRLTRVQRRPRPERLQLQIDQLLRLCSHQLPPDRFQHVYESIADPLSDLHAQFRIQALARHGQLDSEQRIEPRVNRHLLQWSARLQDLSLFYRIWNEQSDVVKQSPQELWKLATSLSGRPSCQGEQHLEITTDLLAALVAHQPYHDARLVYFLFDCVLRFCANSGFETGATLCRILRQKIESNVVVVELGMLLVSDERCRGIQSLRHECFRFFAAALSGQVPQCKQRIVNHLKSIGLLEEANAILSNLEKTAR